MASGHISINAPFYYDGPDFLDQRQGVETLADLDTLTNSVPEGYEVYVKEQSAWYLKQGGDNGAYWKKQTGLQIYNEEDLTKLTEGEKANGDYIVLGNRHEDPANESFLLRSINKLAAEVTKIKTAFETGIESYQGEDTYITRLLGAEDELPESEPLWCVDENDLIEDPDHIDLITGDLFTPKNLITPGSHSLTINATSSNTVRWDKRPSLGTSNYTRQFLYLTVTSLNFALYFDHVSEEQINPYVNFSNLNCPHANRYNICVIVSRKSQGEGNNFIWISIRNFKNNITLLEGYYKLETEEILPSLYDIEEPYSISALLFRDTNILTKFKIYGQYYSTSEFMPTFPGQEDTYKVPHIVIRAVDDISNLGQKLEAPDGMAGNDVTYIKINQGVSYLDFEPIFDKTSRRLFIKYGDYFCSGGVNSEVTPMIASEIIPASFSPGVYDPYSLHSIITEAEYTFKQTWGYRGFISILNSYRKGIPNPQTSAEAEIDGLKISSFYAPLDTDEIFGCSHAYIELENITDLDIPLTGLTLRYLNDTETLDLDLYGEIKAGSTFIIRGKQYSDPKKDANTFVNVEDFDQEWIVNDEPIDLTMNKEKSYGFILYYNNDRQYQDRINPPLINKEQIYKKNTDPNFPYLWAWWYVDGITVNKIYNNLTDYQWGLKHVILESNSITRREHTLDPAIQDEELKSLSLKEDLITFPYSDLSFPVRKFGPVKDKNIFTDKTEFNIQKPNIVFSNPGIDPMRTRCFNWISGGLFDEFVWIREKGTDTWKKFESYNKNNNLDSEVYPKRKKFNYNRTYTTLADGTKITAHKCIIELFGPKDNITKPVTFEYIVGRQNKQNNPDLDHCCTIKEFILYPTTYNPIFYHIANQKGSTWTDYKNWRTVANKLEQKIELDHKTYPNTFPVIVNTGNMTQNGSRINEWLDYYKGGENLFSKYDCLACIGKNDLCNEIPKHIGAGIEQDKINPYFFNLMFCYENCAPSVYYIDYTKIRLIATNPFDTNTDLIENILDNRGVQQMSVIMTPDEYEAELCINEVEENMIERIMLMSSKLYLSLYKITENNKLQYAQSNTEPKWRDVDENEIPLKII